jgi:FKBP-type peptidyl-prolyl cis-trans isomerase SlpA
MAAITSNSKITLHFSLSLDDGSLVDSTFDGKPATFTMGDGSLLPGFEKILLGLSSGQETQALVPPEAAFGQPHPQNVQYFKRSDFDADMDLQEGLIVSFADAARAELPGVIKNVTDTEVMVDFNHPLAGRSLLFKVHIIDVA